MYPGGNRLASGFTGRRPGGTLPAMGSTIRRIFLGYDRPALHAATGLLFERHARGGDWDLSDVTVVVPGRRAGRRLLELLVDRAEADRVLLTPPRITTVGHLPELLYAPDRPVAGAVTCRLALAEALRSTPDEQIRALTPRPPAADDALAWLALAEQIEPVLEELAGACLSPGDVADRGTSVFDDEEARRWRVLEDVVGRCRRQLEDEGLIDRNAARQAALEAGRITPAGQLYLLATVELTASARRMLRALDATVTVLVLADDAIADRFDELGCVRGEAWAEAAIDLGEDQLHLAPGPAEQADHVVRALLAGEAVPAEEVTIGVPDAEVVPYIEQQAALVGWPTRYAEGRRAGSSPTCLLLSAVAEYLESSGSRAFAALIRHPDMQRHLADLPELDQAAVDWLTFHDRYLTDHLQARYAGDWLGDEARRARMKAVHDRVLAMLDKLGGAARPLADWAQPIADLLNAVYGDQPLRGDGSQVRLRGVIDAIVAVLADMTDVPHGVGRSFTTSGGEALRFVARQVAEAPIPPEPDDAAAEMVGWLELPLDDAARMIVAGMNDHVVPESVVAHPFLPNTLRELLGLRDNAARYARDAYVLTAVTKLRPAVPLVAGRRSATGDPRLASRLWFADRPALVAARVRRLYAEDRVRREPLAMQALPVAASSVFNDAGRWPPPPPRPVPPGHLPTRLPVTAFRAYLACPYRFYLAYVERLDATDDSASELDPGQFGSVAHDVLETFGRAAIARSVDPADARAARAALHSALDVHFDRRFGRDLRVVVQVQREMLRHRLDAFADWQADWAADGWRIARVEVNQRAAALDVDGEPFGLTGRIDRIDTHPDGRVAILDYKTSDKPKTPDEVHRTGRDRQWVDLQLPLYRHLAAAEGVIADADARVELGYIRLPRTAEQVGAAIADWSAADLAEADEVARNVIRAIRRSAFYPPGEVDPAFDPYSAICGTELRRDLGGGSDEEGDA